MESLNLLLAFLGGSGVASVVIAVLERRWSKQDKTNAIVNGLKVLMIDRVRYVGNCYIKAQKITMSDKETIKEMHQAYKSLGGNGHLDAVMAEVEKLPIVPD